MNNASRPMEATQEQAKAQAKAKAAWPAKKVPQQARTEFLPRLFGSKAFIRGESLVYAAMSSMCADYHGGMWEFFKTANGAGYMAPKADQQWHLRVSGNFYDGKVSSHAAGIIATLFALCHLINSFDGGSDNEKRLDAFEALKDYAQSHPEASDIFAAID